MFKYELHMHTSEASACSISTVHEMIKKYKEAGFAGAVVTNHFFCGNTAISRSLPWKEFVSEFSKAYYEGKKTAEKLDFDLLFGLEENYGGGKEFLVYGIEPQFLLDHPELLRANITLWSKTVKEAGGFIAYAHPFRVRSYIPDPCAIPDLSLVDGIEVYNYGNNLEDNLKAAYLFKNSDKIKIAGSDHHVAEFSGSYGIYLPTRARTEKELVKALKSNNFRFAVPEDEQ